MTQPCLDHGFLASSEVLESVLLPHLSARDLFKLSCTSKGMQNWLLGTSSHLWQVSKVLCRCALRPLDQASGFRHELGHSRTKSQPQGTSWLAQHLKSYCRMSSPATSPQATWQLFPAQALCWQPCSRPTGPSWQSWLSQSLCSSRLSLLPR